MVILFSIGDDDNDEAFFSEREQLLFAEIAPTLQNIQKWFCLEVVNISFS